MDCVQAIYSDLGEFKSVMYVYGCERQCVWISVREQNTGIQELCVYQMHL